MDINQPLAVDELTSEVDFVNIEGYIIHTDIFTTSDIFGYNNDLFEHIRFQSDMKWYKLYLWRIECFVNIG